MESPGPAAGTPARRLPRVLLVAGAGMALLGAAGMIAGGGPARRAGPGPNVIVNTDRPGLNAHTSPAAAVDPSNPLAIAVADRIDTPRFGCSVHLSRNGGQTWKPVEVPLPPEAPNCFFPDVAFDGRGRLLLVYTAMSGPNNLPVGVWLQPFDGEAPAGPPVQVAGMEAFHARLAVRGSELVVTWVQAGEATREKPLGFGPPPNPILLSRSVDGGRTFAPPVPVSAPDRLVIQPTPLLGPDGLVVVGALDLGDDRVTYEATHQGRTTPTPDGPWRVAAWRSTDGGLTFGPATVVSDVAPPLPMIPDLGYTPSFALGPSGRTVLAAWESGRGDARDVLLSSSPDGGATWSAPTPPLPRPRGQLLPAVAAVPGGRTDLLFYDRSRDPADAMAEVVLASSRDGGRTFTAEVVSDRPFDSRYGLGEGRWLPQLGSQLALVSEEDRALAFWTDTRLGTDATQIQDLAFAAVEAAPPRAPARTVRGGGMAALGAGLALLVVGAATAVRGRRGLRRAP